MIELVREDPPPRTSPRGRTSVWVERLQVQAVEAPGEWCRWPPAKPAKIRAIAAALGLPELDVREVSRSRRNGREPFRAVYVKVLVDADEPSSDVAEPEPPARDPEPDPEPDEEDEAGSRLDVCACGHLRRAHRAGEGRCRIKVCGCLAFDTP